MASAMERFEALLAEYAAADREARQEVRRRMWDTYGQRCAVFVSDLSGFSRISERYNIVHFLSMIHVCRGLLVPVIREGGGSPIKTAADNMYAIFPDAVSAIETSIGMQLRLREHNAGVDPDEQIGLCVGIGHGDVLVIEQQDFFGHELNLAFKLGEDTAEAGEVLVTRAALEAAGLERFPHDLRTVSLSGVTIPHASIHYG
jgi:adenylate cyclase